METEVGHTTTVWPMGTILALIVGDFLAGTFSRLAINTPTVGHAIAYRIMLTGVALRAYDTLLSLHAAVSAVRKDHQARSTSGPYAGVLGASTFPLACPIVIIGRVATEQMLRG